MAATLFFDLDKTLCHPRIPFTQIFFASCAPLLEAPSADVTALLQAWADALEEPGPSTIAGCLARAASVAGISASPQRIERCARALIDGWAATQALDPGVMDILERLTQSHPLGLITNGPSDGQHAVISALGIGNVFRWRIASGDAAVGIRKPHAGIFTLALTMSGSIPQETWYIGDSLANDIAGAAGAGWRTCWLSAPDDDLPEEFPTPDVRISRLDELPQVIGRFE